MKVRRKIRKNKNKNEEIVNANDLTEPELKVARYVVGLLKSTLPVVIGEEPKEFWVKFYPDKSCFFWVNKEKYEEDMKNNTTKYAVASITKETNGDIKIKVDGDKI